MWQILFLFVLLFINLAIIVIGLNCVWRVSHEFKKALALLTIAIAGVGTWFVLAILGLIGASVQINEFLSALFVEVLFLAAFVEFYRIISKLEKSVKKIK